jgi:hypothetical protein
MTPMFGPENTPSFDIGDRVIATHGVAGFLRPKVRPGTPGVITGRSPDGRFIVHFTTGHTLTVDAEQLAARALPEQP